MQPYTGSSWLLDQEGTIVALPGHQQVATSIRYILNYSWLEMQTLSFRVPYREGLKGPSGSLVYVLLL